MNDIYGQQLADIRAKCIEANPEIAEHYTKVRGQVTGTLHHIRTKVGRPIRLADVLLAIGMRPRLQVGINEGLGVMTTGDGTMLRATWNLRTDDLTKQSPKTIAFIHSLLSVSSALSSNAETTQI